MGIRIFIAAATLFPVWAAAVPGDYDGDGSSEVVSVRVVQNGARTRWRLGAVNGQSQGIAINAPGVFPVPGDYLGLGRVQPAIVAAPQDGGALRWSVRRPDGSLAVSRFGKSGDLLVPADYDCDDRTDRAVVRRSRTLAQFIIRRSSDGRKTVMSFGRTGDRFFGADADGDGCAELFAVRIDGAAMVWSYRKLSAPGVAQAVWGGIGDIPLKPADFDGDGMPDLTAVSTSGVKQLGRVQLSGGGVHEAVLGPAGSVPVVGSFTGSVGFGYIDRASGVLTVVGDRTETRAGVGWANAVIVRPDGSAVFPGGDDRLAGPEEPPDDSEYQCDEYMSNRDGTGGYVNNPDNSHRVLKQVLPGGFTGEVADILIGYKGEVIDTFYFKEGYEYGGRERWYSHNHPSEYPRDITIVLVFHTGRTVCVEIPDPTERYD